MEKTRRQRRRKAWFNLGARAIARIEPAAPYCYVCPLCWRSFLPAALEGGELTLEHAPSKALGGREVALTCIACNGRAGSEIDHHTVAREQTLNLARGTMERPMRGARVDIGGHGFSVDLLAQGDLVRLMGAPAKHQKPGTIEGVSEYMSRVVPGESQIHLSVPGYDQWLARLGLLRSAYILAFAALGYTYLRNSAVQLIRQQLADPSAKLVEHFDPTDPTVTPTNQMAFVRRPEWLRSLVVQLGRHFVFLPDLGADVHFYDRLASNRPAEQAQITFAGKGVRWPTAPRHDLDSAQAA